MNTRMSKPERYLMVLNVEMRALGRGRAAMESAFAEHLRQLLQTLGPTAEIRVLSPQMTAERYEQNRDHLAVVDGRKDRIWFRPVYDVPISRAQFMARLPAIGKRVADEVRWSQVIHGGISHDVTRPFAIMALAMGRALGRPMLSVTDMDLRRQAEMMYRSGHWKRRTYLLSRLVFDPLRDLQHRFVAKNCSLVLLKGQDMVADFGGGRESVKFFLDAAFSHQHIIDPERLGAKHEAIRRTDWPLRVVYFGRLVAYKGIDHMLRAAEAAVGAGADLRFTIIGSGDARSELEAESKRLGLEERVRFVGAIPFGPRLFDLLYDQHLLLAAPLHEDTPRSALDAAAAGIPILAYDTPYYRTLASSGAVTVTPWLDDDAMAAALVRLEGDREDVVRMSVAGVEFARDNTQERWLERRAEWTERFLFQTV